MGCSNRHIDESTLEEIFVKAWNSLMENKEAGMQKWERMRKGKNPLLAYRAEQLIKYANMDMQKFDAEQLTGY